jgi:hypothetical protein
MTLVVVLVAAAAVASAESPAPPPPACAASFGAFNLSDFRLVGGDVEASKNTTAAGCLAACCARAGCVAWNYHSSSHNPTHNVRSCWLSSEAAPTVTNVSDDSNFDGDVWEGGASKRCCDDTNGGCPGHRKPLPPPPPAGPPIASCDGSNYTHCRQELWRYIFNTTTGELPSRDTPDFIENLTDWEMVGVPGPGQGSGVGNVRWKMGLQKLVWTIGGAGGGMREGMLRLNSTIWYSRNSSGSAPSNSPPVGFGLPETDEVHCPDESRPGFESWRGQSDTLVIHHNGHQPCSGGHRSTNCSDCTPNFDTAQDWINQLGYDVMEVAMPMHGCNRIQGNTSCKDHCIGSTARGFDCAQCKDQSTTDSMVGSHQWFEQFEAQGDETMRYFLEPVVLAVNYAKNKLKYKHIGEYLTCCPAALQCWTTNPACWCLAPPNLRPYVRTLGFASVMVGLSGGGWTTTISAAIDPRIKLSMPIAGSVPKVRSALYPHFVPDMPGSHGQEGASGDYEQEACVGHELTAKCRPFYQACGWACLYVLAGLDTPSAVSDGLGVRHSLQMLHEHDSCCFATAGLHKNISAYNQFVQAELRKQTSGGSGWFQTAANLGNFHEINYRDKTVLGVMIERLRRPQGITRAHFEDIPFDVLLPGGFQGEL